MTSQVQRTKKKNDGNSRPLIITAASEESHERQHNPLQKSQAMVEKLLSNFQKETTRKEQNKPPTAASLNSFQNKGSNQPCSANASSEKGRENSIRKHTSMEKSQSVTGKHTSIEKSQPVDTSQKKQSTQRSMAQDDGSGANQHNPRKKAKKTPMCRPMSIDEFLHENGEAGDKEDLCIKDEEDELEAMFQDGNTDQEENFESNAGVTKGTN
ncbi:hypothetical protein RIF29_00844 [Crotalaria pallida]|uniref:Uncharacterized protein n=1 Tax=Crotalaria pallida TaxID=3830 RepID=A0AAN9IX82_CROPI